MDAHTRMHIPAELFELRSILETEWPARSAALAASGVPLNEETEEEKTAREAAEAAAAATAATEKKFSQADVDRFVQERLARDRKDRPSDDEIAQLRDKAKKFDDAEAANLTELERERTAREKAEKEREDAVNEAKETRLRSAILAEASKADRKVVDPDAVLSLLDKASLTLDDSGVPTNIAEAMDSLLEKRPFLVAAEGSTTRSSADQGARGGGGDQLSSVEGMSPEQIAAAVSEGKLDTYLATSTK